MPATANQLRVEPAKDEPEGVIRLLLALPKQLLRGLGLWEFGVHLQRGIERLAAALWIAGFEIHMAKWYLRPGHHAVNGFLLDTNLVSEAVSAQPQPKVLAWMDAADERTLFLSVFTLGELRKGTEGLALPSQRRAQLETLAGYRYPAALRRPHSPCG